MKNLIFIGGMPGRVIWTQEQDEILRYLREDRQQKKWSSIAKIMVSEFHIRRRSGKQCRQRNHLAATINRGSWTTEQDKQMIRLHQQYGNKWSLIAQKIPGRTQNCVKNHFYSKLRKAARRLNRWSSDNSQKKEGVFGGDLLSKIVAVSETRFMSNSKKNDQWVHFTLDIIKRLYNIDKSFIKCEESEIDEEQQAQLSRLQADIINFDQNYRKPRRKSFRNIHLNHFQRASNNKQNFDNHIQQNIRAFLSNNDKSKSQNHIEKQDLNSLQKLQQCQYQQIPNTGVKSQINKKMELEKEKAEKKGEAKLIDSLEMDQNELFQKNSRTYKLTGTFDQNQQFLGISLPGTFESFCELERQMNWRDSRSKILCFEGVQQSQSCLFNVDSNYSI